MNSNELCFCLRTYALLYLDHGEDLGKYLDPPQRKEKIGLNGINLKKGNCSFLSLINIFNSANFLRQGLFF